MNLCLKIWSAFLIPNASASLNYINHKNVDQTSPYHSIKSCQCQHNLPLASPSTMDIDDPLGRGIHWPSPSIATCQFLLMFNLLTHWNCFLAITQWAIQALIKSTTSSVSFTYPLKNEDYYSSHSIKTESHKHSVTYPLMVFFPTHSSSQKMESRTIFNWKMVVLALGSPSLNLFKFLHTLDFSDQGTLP